MEQTVLRESLLQAALLVKPALASQSYIPALTHICFDGVTMLAYNDISAIMVRSPIEMEMCVPGDLLIKALGSLTADELLMQQDTSGNLLLAAGRSKLKLPTLPIADFPFEEPEVARTIKLSASILKGIEKCLVAVGHDPTHPAQMGITMEAGKDGATLYSTDNFTISRYQTDTKISLPASVPVILPTFFCEQIVSLAKAYPDEPVELAIQAGSLIAVVGDTAKLFTKQLVDLEPMNFDTILKKYHVDEVIKEAAIAIPDSFDASFDRALMILANEMDKVTKVTMTGDKMKILSTSSLGEASDSFTYKDPNAPAEPFFVDPALVSRGSKICSKVAILEKVMVLGNEDLSFTHLIAHCVA